MSVQRIAVINAKGGSGKSTIATNLSVLFASAQHQTVLMDTDPQGSACGWHAQRSPERPPIHLIDTMHLQRRQTRAFQTALPAGTERLVIDTPAGIQGGTLQLVLDRADTILVPVVPSPIDIRATALFLGQLSKEYRVRHGGVRIGIIANRIYREQALPPAFERLLADLGLPLVAELHESSVYQQAADEGLGIHDDSNHAVARERQDWLGLARWLALPEGSTDRPQQTLPSVEQHQRWRLVTAR